MDVKQNCVKYQIERILHENLLFTRKSYWSSVTLQGQLIH